MNRLEQAAQCINVLGDFCGMRDVPALTSDLEADAMVLFGGSPLSGGDVLAEAMKNRVARRYIIVGGSGHTTETLRKNVRLSCPGVLTRRRSEAELLDSYIEYHYGVHADYLETKSTNCGNNITHMLALMQQNQIPIHRLILTQDAAMQRRMDAGLRKFAEPDAQIINYAAYHAHVIVKDDALAFEENIPGMWDMDRYVSLLMGEIPRLTDNADGYGPLGRGYIAHVDVPDDVREAFVWLRDGYGACVRE